LRRVMRAEGVRNALKLSREPARLEVVSDEL
jgi:hypothetical protein